MVEQTVRERVQQALARHFELLAEKETAQDTVGKATSARNGVVNSTTVAEVTATADALKDRSAKTAQTKYEEILTDARNPLAKAQEAYDKVEEKARSVMQSTNEKAESAFQGKVDKAQQEYDVELATAEAEVYRAKNEVRALQDTIGQHREETGRKLGAETALMLTNLT